MAGSTS